MLTTPENPPLTTGRALLTVLLITAGITILYWGLVFFAPHGSQYLTKWWATWQYQRVYNACARHNNIDPSPYHMRSNGDEAVMAQCLALHWPQPAVEAPPQPLNSTYRPHSDPDPALDAWKKEMENLPTQRTAKDVARDARQQAVEDHFSALSKQLLTPRQP